MLRTVPVVSVPPGVTPRRAVSVRMAGQGGGVRVMSMSVTSPLCSKSARLSRQCVSTHLVDTGVSVYKVTPWTALESVKVNLINLACVRACMCVCVWCGQ